MGTRALVHIKEDEQTLLTVYRQMDGYPTGLGQDIKDILAKGKSKLVNGYSRKDVTPEVFNGMGCLAAYLVGKLKMQHEEEQTPEDIKTFGKRSAIGSIYIFPPNSSGVDEDYTYTLYNGKDNTIMLTVQAGYDSVYDGPLSKFDAKRVENSQE
jgi:hypothetical protein